MDRHIVICNVEKIMKNFVNMKKNTMANGNIIKVPLQLKRVIIVSKTTKLDYETKKHPELNFQQLLALFKRHGLVYNNMKMKHSQQIKYISEMCSALRDHFIETRVVSGDEYLTENVEWADAVFSVGGDGTFLMAAAKVTGQKPVIGFNSDPEGSEGHLCLTGKSFHSVSEVISDLFKGKFSWIRRQRIRVTLLKVVNDERLSSESDDNENGRQINNGSFRAYNPGVPLLALNDVFMGEIHAARVSSYDVQIDNNPVIRQKSSGLTVSTGTGSTAWYYTINRLSAQDVGEILSIVNSMGLMNIEVNDQQNKEISERFSQNLLFDPSSPEMAFAIREPVYNKTFKEIPPRGFAKRIFLKSRCSDGQLVLDGSITVPFNEGSEVLLEIFNEDALLSAIQA